MKLGRAGWRKNRIARKQRVVASSVRTVAATNSVLELKVGAGGWLMASAGASGGEAGAGLDSGASRAATGNGSCSNDGSTRGVGCGGRAGLGVRRFFGSSTGRGLDSAGSIFGWSGAGRGGAAGAEDSASFAVV
jgi:hypothetical protein